MMNMYQVSFQMWGAQWIYTKLLHKPPGKITHREMSCFSVQWGEICQCHNPIQIDFNQSEIEENVEAITTTQHPLQISSLDLWSPTLCWPCSPGGGRLNCAVWDKSVVRTYLCGQRHLRSSFTKDTTYIQAIISEPQPYTNRSSQLRSQDWRKFSEMW